MAKFYQYLKVIAGDVFYSRSAFVDGKASSVFMVRSQKPNEIVGSAEAKGESQLAALHVNVRETAINSLMELYPLAVMPASISCRITATVVTLFAISHVL